MGGANFTGTWQSIPVNVTIIGNITVNHVITYEMNIEVVVPFMDQALFETRFSSFNDATIQNNLQSIFYPLITEGPTIETTQTSRISTTTTVTPTTTRTTSTTPTAVQAEAGSDAVDTTMIALAVAIPVVLVAGGVYLVPKLRGHTPFTKV